MNKYEIEESLLQKTLNYLATKPYAEVFQLIQEMQANAKFIEPIQIKEEPKKSKG